MRVCNLCKMEKRNDQFISIRGKTLKLCLRCRNTNYKRKKNNNIEVEVKQEETPQKIDAEEVKEDEKKQIELVSLRDFVDKIKPEIALSIKSYNREEIIDFFQNKEPKIIEVFELIKNDELKDLIKVWLNTKFIEENND